MTPATSPAPHGVDPRWIRSVRTPDATGVERTWHVLDNQPSLEGATPAGTLLCVHGNPTSSYLWRHVLAAAASAGRPWRAIAMDQLNMGLSERTGVKRRLATRIDDLARLTDALELDGPVVTVGHDWGGIISLSWAVSHPDQLAGVVLLNTAVHQPPGSPLPVLIEGARTPGVRKLVTGTTPAFLRGTLALAHPRLPAEVQAGYLDPYRGAGRRTGIDDFVEDIPVKPEHPSYFALQTVVEALPDLAGVPSLLLWGPRDPVFTDLYLRDVRSRLPHAQVHRFEDAGHLVAEDANVSGAIGQWLVDAVEPAISGDPTSLETSAETAPTAAHGRHRKPLAGKSRRALWAPLQRRADEYTAALVEPSHTGPAGTTSWRTTTWRHLALEVDQVASGLIESGVQPGDRVALLVPPGADLTVALYACLRIGAVGVIADAGLGLPGLNRAIRGSAVRHVIAIDRGLVAARALSWPGRRIGVGRPSPRRRRLLNITTTLDELRTTPVGALPAEPEADAEALVVFTSGSTGPAKGVVYTHGQLEAVRDTLLAAYDLRSDSENGQDDDRFVAAFAPFALFGPALGIASVVPAMDVTAPRTLTAQALAQAARAIDATLVFASPAALTNVLSTETGLDDADRDALRRVWLLLSAGAPVPVGLLTSLQALLPAAKLHTPYGMTEALLVSDVDLGELHDAGHGNGVLVGKPLPGVEVLISPLDSTGTATDAEPTAKPGVTGEILVRAGHVKDHYDQLWLTQRATATPDGRHRTGDVGHLDTEGRLWVEGRLVHVLSPASGYVTPVGVEQRIETVPSVRRAALVGIGPVGGQHLVAVLETAGGKPGVADLELAAQVRAAAAVDLAAVLITDGLKTDIRHNSKIDRAEVSDWAARRLAGSR